MINTLLLDALACHNKKRPPIWFMRQAGRYMPEYRALRQKYSFLQLCKTPELALEVSLLPIHLLDVDAAILFSDILLILELFNISLKYDENKGPVLSSEIPLDQLQLISKEDIEEKLSFVFDTITLLKKELSVPLLGFCGAPFTLATYLIEGGTGKDFKTTKQWLYQSPKAFHTLLDKLTQATIIYLQKQVDAGVDALQIFDSWANVLPLSLFNEFSTCYLQKIINALKPTKIPIILFSRGIALFAEEWCRLAPQGITLDWHCNLANIRKRIPHPIALQGNLDPDLLIHAHKAALKTAVDHTLLHMQNDPGYIFNLGHGIKPATPLDKVKFVVDYVKSK